MRKYLIFVFFCSIIVHSVISYGKTLSGNPDSFEKKSLTISADDDYPRSSFDSSRHKRDTESNITNSVNVKITRLDDRHKQLMVHWVSDGSEIIVCLARDPSPSSDIVHGIPSAVYISYNYGDTFDNKTDSFKLADGNYSTLDKFYNHQKLNRFFIFSDVKHKTIFVTSDYGHNIKRLKLDFSPSDISFHEYKPNTFLVHDKSTPEQLVSNQ
ncbi:hypothetical protein WA026_016216 [Henosepilachna vigintioctopunctata]|uniref:Sortilin N-terminal domain-containing protein n=1 Tax=Henosepilachna vigintioctopunctata TaxID=420089 RepID=A0AAW1TVP5_9CUCU